MANITEVDLGSRLVDLTTVPLYELRSLNTSTLVEALEHAYSAAEFDTGNDLQDQKA